MRGNHANKLQCDPENKNGIIDTVKQIFSLFQFVLYFLFSHLKRKKITNTKYKIDKVVKFVLNILEGT